MSDATCISIVERKCDFFAIGGSISATTSLNRILKLVLDCKGQQIAREKRKAMKEENFEARG